MKLKVTDLMFEKPSFQFLFSSLHIRLIITAPPDDIAVNKKINTVLNDVTNDTPEMSASLEKLTKKSVSYTNKH